MLSKHAPASAKISAMKRGYFSVLAGLAIAAAMSGTASANSVTVLAGRDNTLFEDPSGLLSSGAGEGIFAGKNSQNLTRRALVFFDVASAVPAGATIDSVELWLNVNSAPNATPQPVSIHRALASWGEGTSASTGGGGAPASTGDATWLHRFYSDTFWSTPGGDFEPGSSATTTVGVVGLHVWKSTALALDVAGWLATPSANFGWLIRGPENAASTVRRFDSRETDIGPKLIVYFTPLPTSTRPTTWGQVKTLYR
jgi:hypothetical protein